MGRYFEHKECIFLLWNADHIGWVEATVLEKLSYHVFN
jgi:hypothetical protein